MLILLAKSILWIGMLYRQYDFLITIKSTCSQLPFGNDASQVASLALLEMISVWAYSTIICRALSQGRFVPCPMTSEGHTIWGKEVPRAVPGAALEYCVRCQVD